MGNNLTLQELQQLKEEHLEATLPAVLNYLEGVRPSDQLQEAVQLFFEAKGYDLTEEDVLRLVVLTSEDKDIAVSLPAFTPEGLDKAGIKVDAFTELLTDLDRLLQAEGKATKRQAKDALKALLPGLITDLTFAEYLDRYEIHFGEVQAKAGLLDFSGQLERRKYGS